MECDKGISRMYAQAAFAQYAFSSVDGNRNAERPRTNGKKERAFFERQHAASFRARAFYKRRDVNALCQYAFCCGNTLFGGCRTAGSIDCDKFTLAKARAKHRNLHERAF